LALRGWRVEDDEQRRFVQEARRAESLLLRVVVVVAEVVAQLDDDAGADCGAEFAVQIANQWYWHSMHDDYNYTVVVAVAAPSVIGSGQFGRQIRSIDL